jgi:hypothetical protein
METLSKRELERETLSEIAIETLLKRKRHFLTH